MSFFENKLNFRIREEEIKEIDKIINKDPDRYKDRSHFVRVAIMKELRKNS